MFNGLKPREEIAMRSAITALQEGSETPTTGTSSTSNLSTPWEEKDLDSSTAARKSLGSQLTEALRPDSPETHQARKKARHEAKQANQISNPNRRGKVDDVLGGGSETTLSSEAMEAILELRRVRDAEDNFARYRDMDRPPLPVALQIAEQAGNGGGKIDGRAHIGQGSISAKRGLRMMSKQEREKIASANYSTVTSVPSGNGQNEDKDDGEMDDPLGYVGKDEKGEYCKVCGIPLLPDPKPDMLLIWLHAIRYRKRLLCGSCSDLAH